MIYLWLLGLNVEQTQQFKRIPAIKVKRERATIRISTNRKVTRESAL